MCVTGPAGAGKCKAQFEFGFHHNIDSVLTLACFKMIAKLLEELIAYASQFSQKIGHVFTKKTIRVTAMTGCAAMEIGGATTASVFKYIQKNDHATQADIEDFADTRMNTIDEISFANLDILMKISDKLKMFTECQQFQYGSIPICFWGDFCQLEPITGSCIYTNLSMARIGNRH
jgi:PIF1-like helicase